MVLAQKRLIALFLVIIIVFNSGCVYRANANTGQNELQSANAAVGILISGILVGVAYHAIVYQWWYYYLGFALAGGLLYTAVLFIGCSITNDECKP